MESKEGSMSLPNVKQVRERIVDASKSGWDSLREELERNANRDIVTVTWDVTYDPLGHDIIVHYEANVAEPETYLLQIWAMDQHPGIYIPEYRPWVASVVEFTPADQVTGCKGGVLDSKWSKEDAGEKYVALVWGYVHQRDSVVQFGPFEKEFVYPG
jgi:hypothetical protein